MENGKHKVRVCLSVVLLAAVVIGMIYYYQHRSAPAESNEGTLIRAEKEVADGC